MGYRHHIGILSKEKHECIKDLNLKDLQKWFGDDRVPCYKIAEELYELGKYYDDEFLKPYRKEVFSNTEVTSYFVQDNDFYIIGKEGLRAIIDNIHDKNLEHFQTLLENKPTPLGEDKREQYFRRKVDLWGNRKFKLFPYSLEGSALVSSWMWEYAIFEIVKIYKEIDYDKNHVVITAW